MPKEFYEQLLLLQRYANRQLLFWIALIISGGLLLVAAIHKAVQLICAMIVLFCVSIVLFVRNEKSVNKLATGGYAMQIETGSLGAVVKALNCEALSANEFVSIRDFNGCTIRLLAQYVPVFDKEEITKKRARLNKLINKKYCVSEWVSRDTAGKMLRINLVVCDQETQQLFAWVTTGANQLIHRNESIFQAAIVLESNTFFFPAISEGVTLNELKKYRTAAAFLEEALGGNHPNVSRGRFS